MPRVFIPSIPSRFDPGSKLWIPTVETKPAERFGELLVMLPPNGSRAGLAPCVDAIRDKMRDFTTEDFVVCVGDPSLIGAACCIAARKAGGTLRMLKWDRMAKDYFLAEVRP